MNQENFYREVLSYLDRRKTPEGWILKSVEKRINVTDVHPYNLHKFLKANGVPNDCDWGYEEDGYDGATFETYVSWDIKVPYTEKEAYNAFTSLMSRNMGSLILKYAKTYKLNFNIRKFDNKLGLKLYLKSHNDFIDYLDTFFGLNY